MRRSLRPWAYVAPALLLFLVFVAYPVVETIRSSFLDWDGISGEKAWIGLANYREMVEGTDPYFWGAVRNTLVWTAVSVPLQLLTGLAMALALNRGLRGTVFFRTAFFMPAVLSSAVVAFAWGWFYNPQDGLITRTMRLFGGTGQGWLGEPKFTLWASIVVVVWRYTGLSMLFYLAMMQLIPESLYDAAQVDGASWWQQTRKITIPMLRPMTALLTMFGVIGALREFEVIFIMTRGGPAHATDLMSIQIFQQAFDLSRPGYAAAIATALLVLTALISAVMLVIIGRAHRSLS